MATNLMMPEREKIQLHNLQTPPSHPQAQLVRIIQNMIMRFLTMNVMRKEVVTKEVVTKEVVMNGRGDKWEW